MDVPEQALYFGKLKICPLTNILTDGSRSIKVSPKVMEVLVALMMANGKVITREEMLSTHWSARVGADESLTRAVSEIRKSFRSLKPEAAKAVETIPKRGYRIKVDELSALFSDNCSHPAIHQPRPFSKILNIKYLVVAVLLPCCALLMVIYSQNLRVQEKEIPIVAVLPLQDINNNSEQSDYGKGLAEEIINGLTRIDGLLTISRTSSFEFDSDSYSVDEIARKLHADFLVEGHVRRDKSMISVGVRLINTANGETVWSKVFNREYQDLISLREEVTHEIAHALNIVMTPPNYTNQIGMTAQIHPYNLFIQGRNHAYERDSLSLRRSVQNLSEAVSLDPNFHLAKAQLFVVYEMAKTYGGFTHEYINDEQSRLYFELQAAPDFPMKRIVEALYARVHQHTSLSLQKIKEAYEEAPNDPFIQSFAINYLLPEQSLSLHIQERLKLMKINPLDTVNMLNLAEMGYMAGETTLSKDALERIHVLKPDSEISLIGSVTKHYSFDRNPYEAFEAVNSYQGEPSVIAQDFAVKLLIITGRYKEAISILNQQLLERRLLTPQLKSQLVLLHYKQRIGSLTLEESDSLARLPLNAYALQEITMLLSLHLGESDLFEQFYGVNGEVNLFRFKQLREIPQSYLILYAAIKKRQGKDEFAKEVLISPFVEELKCQDDAVRYPNTWCNVVGFLRNRETSSLFFREFQRSLKVLYIRDLGIELFIKTSPLYYGVDEHPQFDAVANTFINSTFSTWENKRHTTEKTVSHSSTISN